MNIFDATECAYKNGYRKGFQEGAAAGFSSILPKAYLKLRRCKNKQEFVETAIEIVNDLGGNRFTTLYQNLPD